MSPDLEFRCVDCKCIAPDLGGGYLGTVASHDVNEPDPRRGATFGYYYQPLRLLGICPYNLHAFWEFLEAHAGHRVCVAGAVDDDGVFAEDLYWERDDEQAENAIDEDIERWDERRAERIASGEFVSAVYQVLCEPCGESFMAPRADVIRQFEPLAVTDDAVHMFLGRWASPGKAVEAEWLLSIVDPAEPFIDGLAQFLRKHQKVRRSWFRRAPRHALVAKLDARAE
jgi:hypothetical protein